MSKTGEPVTGLRRLAEKGGVDFPALFAARERTEVGLMERREALERLSCDADIAVVLMGSWGRGEITSESDDDFMLVVAGERREGLNPPLEAVSTILDSAPGPEDIFGKPVYVEDMRDKIGLRDDTNDNLTRRMLMLLESTPAYNQATWARVRQELLDGYMATEVKAYRPPRFMLNDVVRYWRTIAVDFEAKHRSRSGEGWGLRNAKLRLSRKLLFSSGLLPVLECHDHGAEEIPSFLAGRLELKPADRVAEAFLTYDSAEAGVRAFRAYDTFVSKVDDPEFRQALKSLALHDSDLSEDFRLVRDLGREFQAGLLSLLFDTSLYRFVREFAIY